MLFGAAVDWARWHPRMLGLLRLFVALLFLQHGLAKLADFPVAAPANFSWFSLLGVAGVIEIVGSLMLLLGLYTREAAFVMAGEMAVAYFMLRPKISFYPIANRGELEALYSFVFLYFVFAGPGTWSLNSRRPGLRHLTTEPSRRR